MSDNGGRQKIDSAEREFEDQNNPDRTSGGDSKRIPPGSVYDAADAGAGCPAGSTGVVEQLSGSEIPGGLPDRWRDRRRGTAGLHWPDAAHGIAD